jgi:hypothetical protein
VTAKTPELNHDAAQVAIAWTQALQDQHDMLEVALDQLLRLTDEIAKLRDRMDAQDTHATVNIGLLESIRDHLVKIRLAGE